MGCSVSKPSGEDNAAAMVSICRERKRLMKLAIRRRHAFAIAQFKYNKALYSIAMAIKSFSSSHQTQFPITEPVPERESEKKDSNSDGDGDEDETEICEHFYDDDTIGVPLMQCSGSVTAGEGDNNNYGWDFFNLFEGWKTEVVGNVYGGGGEREGKKEKEGKSVVVVGEANVRRGDRGKKKELFEGLKEVEESLVKSSECGLEVSRMLEISADLQPRFRKFQESPSPMKSPFQSITWGRSMSSSSSSCRTFFSLSSPCSSTLTDVSNNYFLEEHKELMISGSHSLTLGRLYAWEDKLYQEVKVGEYTRKMYQQKCWQLKNQDGKCKGPSSPEKTKAEVRDLYSRILVATRRIDSISQIILKLKDDELHPQLVELLNGLMSAWKIMLETHKVQNEAISKVKKFTHNNITELCNDSHRLATFRLENEVQNWCFCFTEYVSAQKAYAESLNGWLSIVNSSQAKSHNIGSFFGMPSSDDPPSFYITREWLNLLQNLPEKPVISAMKSLRKNIRDMWVQQGDEQLQKRKIEGLKKELDREEVKKVENVSYRAEYLNERKRLIDDLRKKLEREKEKYCDCTEETRRGTLSVFKSEFGSVFDSLIEFSKVSLKMYADLVADRDKKVVNK